MANKEKEKNGEPRVLFDVDEAEERTFVTGGGLPKKQKFMQEQEDDTEPKKYYANEEDELLDRVNKTEEEMNEMLKYLEDVDSWVNGDDLS